ncbi:ribosome silencing factor [Actinomyces sp.]|uniref:ribosome silencing factor n=1 Tax=Actinomyces sp. TaxID=29317 RepID=UPI0026DB1C48|nr:ribosome silencing factor [Actinomyces sp.]MDO4899504.1 ribosome silencing factor [Actinomyces sp.]
MPATEHAVDLAAVAAGAAIEKQADNAIAVDVSERLPFADVFLIVSAASERRARAVVEAVEEAMFKAGAKARSREGLEEARWVLLDFGDVVVHVFQAEDREYYGLERLWKDCPLVELPAIEPVGTQG